ncbi:hypothetical protein GCM10009780_15470 [Actinomadura alba]
MATVSVPAALLAACSADPPVAELKRMAVAPEAVKARAERRASIDERLAPFNVRGLTHGFTVISDSCSGPRPYTFEDGRDPWLLTCQMSGTSVYGVKGGRIVDVLRQIETAKIIDDKPAGSQANVAIDYYVKRGRTDESTLLPAPGLDDGRVVVGWDVTRPLISQVEALSATCPPSGVAFGQCSVDAGAGASVAELRRRFGMVLRVRVVTGTSYYRLPRHR